MGLKEQYSIGTHSPTETDPEKAGVPAYSYDDAPAVPGEVFVQGNTLYAKLQRLVTRFGVEPRGIERVPEDERTDTNLVKVGTVVSVPVYKNKACKSLWTGG